MAGLGEPQATADAGSMTENRELLLSENVAGGSRTASTHYWRLAASRSTLPGLTMLNVTPLFEFVLWLVAAGSLLIILYFGLRSSRS